MMKAKTLNNWMWITLGSLAIFAAGFSTGSIVSIVGPDEEVKSRVEVLLDNADSSSNEPSLTFRLDDLSTEVGDIVYMSHWLEMYHEDPMSSWDPMALVFGYVDDKAQCEEWADWMREKYFMREYRCTPWARHSNTFK